MTCKPHKNGSSLPYSGFAVGIVLVALVLGLVVVAAIATGTGSAGPFARTNKYRLSATTIVNQAESLSSSFDAAEELGYTIDQILIGDVSADGTMSCASVASPNYCLYNTSNGIDEPMPPSHSVTRYVGWKKSSGTVVQDDNGNNLATSAFDYIVFLVRVDDNVCRQLNTLVIGASIDDAIPSGTTTLTTSAWSDPDGNSFPQVTNITAITTDLSGTTLTSVPFALCYADSTNNYNIFYYAVQSN